MNQDRYAVIDTKDQNVTQVRWHATLAAAYKDWYQEPSNRQIVKAVDVEIIEKRK